MFGQLNHKGRLNHWFRTVDEVRQQHGRCLICKQTHFYDPGKIDVRFWSPPCDPYSLLRWTGGTTTATKEDKDHPDYAVAMELIPDVEDASPAHITIVEEVWVFLKPDKTGMSPCQRLVVSLELRYGKGHVKVVKLNADIWIEIQRPRVFVGGFASAVGGGQAAKDWVALVDEITRRRVMSRPTLVWGVLFTQQEVVLWKEQARLAGMQDSAATSVVVF